MPIYMDRHEVPAEVTPIHVAEMHQQDLKIQHLYGCRGMTYWCDSDRQMAFCLIEAPDKDSINAMHEHAHGAVPHKIIEVDPSLVESFLGRIEDPKRIKGNEVPVIDETAYRVVLNLETSNFLHRLESDQYSIFTQKFHHSVTNSLEQYEGRIVKQDNHGYLVSFKSVTNAILCALKIRSNFKFITPKFDPSIRQLHMGIHAGVPVDGQNSFFGDVVSTATNMCEYMNDALVISSEVQKLYENENRNARIDHDSFRILGRREVEFLNRLVAFCEKRFNEDDISVPEIGNALGCSKSKLYRRLKKLTGRSPNRFLREFRLRKALRMLHNNYGSVSEIAYESGFNNPAYFSKCFSETFGILPSKYQQQHVY
jgi:AraC-like DNA-binding protein